MRIQRGLLAAVVGTLAVVLWGFTAQAEEQSHDHDHGAPKYARTHTWSDGTLDVFSRIPVQDGGRIKPLSTVANFSLLRLSGKRTAKTRDGDKISSIEWLLDCLFFPEVAVGEEVFLVENDEVLDAVGLSHEGKKKRDRYAYVELHPARDKLFSLRDQYVHIDAKLRTPVQAQVVRLAENMYRFEQFIHYLDFTERTFAVDGTPRLAEIFDGLEKPSFGQVLARGREILRLIADVDRNSPEMTEEQQQETAALGAFLHDLDDAGRTAQGLALFPPAVGRKEAPEWMDPAQLSLAAIWTVQPVQRQVVLLTELEHMAAVSREPGEFEKHAQEFQAGIADLAGARGEFDKIDLEISYYKADYFFYALILFLVGFLMASCRWLFPASKKLRAVIPYPVIAGALVLSIGITVRCVLRDRPPVTTLYETILFISATAVIVSLVTEYINRQGIAVALAGFLGATGMFVANRYELHEAQDTMPSLVAVLDTNFWLSTHVTTVTIGYAAGLLAAAVAHVYLFGKVLGLAKNNAAFYKTVSRMTYGLICFGLLFSLIGTVLGGIWANESWGRFWGWDPKENGALLIILWELIILHARLGGYIRDFGLAMCAVFGGMIVAFSWWGVNLLGIGLHSYGFTSGAMKGLMIFYGIEVVALGAGVLLWLTSRHTETPGSGDAPPVPPSA